MLLFLLIKIHFEYFKAHRDGCYKKDWNFPKQNHEGSNLTCNEHLLRFAVDIYLSYLTSSTTLNDSTCLYRDIQVEKSMFLVVIMSVIVRKKVHLKMCLILNGDRDSAL